MAMTITADNLLLMPKLDCNGGYDVAMKGLSVVVIGLCQVFFFLPMPVAEASLCRVCGLLDDFDNSLMPDSRQDFVKVAG
jgi:hypothetical protein